MFVTLEVFSVWLIRVAVVCFGIAIIYNLHNEKFAYRTTRKKSDGTEYYYLMTWPEFIRCLWKNGDYGLFAAIFVWFVFAIPYIGSLIVH